EATTLMPSDLSGEAIGAKLKTKWLGREYLYYPEVDSTNVRIDALAQDGAKHGTVMVAELQTEGRGRQGRVWHSPAGLNVHLSALLRPSWPAALAPPLSLAVGVALAEALAPRLPQQPALKWPNDVLYRGKKLAGILVEAASRKEQFAHVVLGVGLNVNSHEFPNSLAETATSLRMATGGNSDRGEVLAAVLLRMEYWFDRLEEEGGAAAINAWSRWASGIGSEITTQQGERRLNGVALGIDDQGALRLRDRHGVVHVIRSGEILRSV
ncbi:MAG: biotin--[acetyl-CoA-carboxylase] ligase, partial [Planctomycetota bacterium]